MPPIVLSPCVKWMLTALGGAVIIPWVVMEARRVNEELDALRARIRDQEHWPTLRRDPLTGDYRL